jgi:hypothetical protein
MHDVNFHSDRYLHYIIDYIQFLVILIIYFYKIQLMIQLILPIFLDIRLVLIYYY